MPPSFLSRIEGGQTDPRLSRLPGLAVIYDVSSQLLAERYEIERNLEEVTVSEEAKPFKDVVREARDLKTTGFYAEALAFLTVHRQRLERHGDGAPESERTQQIHHLRLGELECMVHLGYYASAKEQSEELLDDPELTPERRLMAWQTCVASSFYRQRFRVALANLRDAERELAESSGPPRMKADFLVLRGNLQLELGHAREAVAPYTEALKLYETLAIPFEVCRTRVHLGAAWIALEKPAAARRALEPALKEAEASGYDQLKALGLSNLVLVAHRQQRYDELRRCAVRSNEIARERRLYPILFRNTWYLLQLARQESDLGQIESYERTLRTYIGRMPDSMPEAEAYRAGEEQARKGDDA